MGVERNDDWQEGLQQVEHIAIVMDRVIPEIWVGFLCSGANLYGIMSWTKFQQGFSLFLPQIIAIFDNLWLVECIEGVEEG